MNTEDIMLNEINRRKSGTSGSHPQSYLPRRQRSGDLISKKTLHQKGLVEWLKV
jgi:hypothetical protein